MIVYHTWAKPGGEVFEKEKVEPKKLDEILHFLRNLKNKTDKIMSLILYVQCKLLWTDIFVNVAILEICFGRSYLR